MNSQSTRASRSASHSSESAARPRIRQLSGPVGSATPSEAGSRAATNSADAAKVTSTSTCGCARAIELVRNSAASPVGSSRGVKRAPVANGSPTRSTRNVRQSSRPRSYATRYQRRAVDTRRYGSTCRLVSAPSFAR